jgi:UDP-N-acetylmuramate dehydrogenase
MSKHTSFQIGGPSEVMLFPRSTDELADILKVSSLLDCKCAILGAGTNVLAPDAGLDGMVICLKDGLADMKRIDRTRILVGAGVTMARAAVYAAGLGLSGLEFAHGIPGTVGGGVYMNAGAYGGEIADVCESVDVMIGDGTVVNYRADEMDFSYRHSRVEEDGCIVLSAVFRLQEKPESEIRAQMQDLKQRRTASQPLDMPSAGSAFKRPVGGYAAALIDGAGLKGFRVGDAAVSEKHAGFVVNLGKAKASDVLTLLQEVSDRVYSGSGIRLEPEMRIW